MSCSRKPSGQTGHCEEHLPPSSSRLLLSFSLHARRDKGHEQHFRQRRGRGYLFAARAGAKHSASEILVAPVVGSGSAVALADELVADARLVFGIDAPQNPSVESPAEAQALVPFSLPKDGRSIRTLPNGVNCTAEKRLIAAHYAFHGKPKRPLAEALAALGVGRTALYKWKSEYEDLVKYVSSAQVVCIGIDWYH